MQLAAVAHDRSHFSRAIVTNLVVLAVLARIVF